MSLTCTACQDRLIDYRFGELDAAERRDVAAHLADCGGCAVAYCRLDADVSGIGAALYEAPPAHVHAALRAQVAAEFRPPLRKRLAALFTRRIPIYQGALATLGAAAAVVVINATLNPAPVPAPSPAAPAIEAVAPTAPAARELLDDYDASSVRELDPYLL